MSKDISDAETEVAIDSDELAGMVESNPELEVMPDLLAAGYEVAERYRIIRHLGSGGMGHVYLAEHTAIGKEVAIKTLNIEFARRKTLRERFLREARSASQIRHPNVVDITDFGSTKEGAPFIAMEYLDGEDLHQLLEREGRLPFERARHLTLQICRALQAAHEKGIIHRDIKPANCFRVERTGVPDVIKVVDFGIAKTTFGTTESTELTKTGVIVGTAAYMSPEQARGESDIDARADVYSVGVILFRMLSGSMPYKSKTPLGMITKHITDPIPSLLEVAPDAGLSRQVDEIVTKALAKEREDRYQSVGELAAALADVDELAAASMPASAGSRRLLMWVGGGTLAGVLIAGVTLWATSKDEVQAPTPEVEVEVEPAPEPNAEPQPQPEPAAATTVSVRLLGAPDGATVRVGEVERGPASEPFELDKSAETVTIEVSAPGFASTSIVVVPTGDLEVPVTLEPKPEAEPEAEPEPEPEPVTKVGKKRPKQPDKPDNNGGVDKEIGF